jgi:hypothetical protein
VAKVTKTEQKSVSYTFELSEQEAALVRELVGKVACDGVAGDIAMSLFDTIENADIDFELWDKFVIDGDDLVVREHK